MVRVSVLLAVYNDEENILNAISSVAAQTLDLKDWELIIIDDCSTDNTKNIIKNAMMRSVYNIKLLSNEKNVGTFMSLNRGLLVASGEYITRIDSDDRIANNKLHIQLSLMDDFDKKYVATYCLYQRDNHTPILGEVTMMFRKSIIDKIGYYDNVRFGADTEFINRILKFYGRCHLYIQYSKTLYYAKKRENSLTTSSVTGVWVITQ